MSNSLEWSPTPRLAMPSISKRAASRLMFFCAALAVIVALGGAALAQSALASYPMVIAHQLGETRLEKQPERVVVFDFGALPDTLDKLGVDVVGLPKTLIGLPRQVSRRSLRQRRLPSRARL